jgi:integrase
MASFQKISGNWRAVVRRAGVYRCKTFASKAAAEAWASKTESEIFAGEFSPMNKHTFGDLLDRYSREVAEHKAGRRWEQLRIALIQRDPVAQVKLSELSKRHFAEWRDRRLKSVSARSVIREWAILSHAIKTAINDWEWLTTNPIAGVTKPTGSPPRDRLPTAAEIERLCLSLGWDGQSVPMGVAARVGAAFMFAIETAMRAQEICGLTVTDITDKVATVRASKTLAGVRRVPLSPEAKRIIELMQKVDLPGDSIFHLTPSQIDANFRKAKKMALVDGLHFHDSRAEAITRLAKKLQILDLARMVGHKDLRMLQVYYRISAEDISDKL